ncbi:hypothetical protein ABG067_006624 [Albugo candida]
MTASISNAHIQIRDLTEPFPIHNIDTESYARLLPISSDTVKTHTATFSTETSTSSPRRKKRRRRTAAQIDRKFRCNYSGCTKAYGSEGSLIQHQRLKHVQPKRSSFNCKNQIDSTIYANLHNNPKSSLVPTALSINHQVHRNVNIRPAIKDDMLQFLVRSEQSHPDCKFTKTHQHGIPSKPNMRSRSNSLPLRLSNGMYLTAPECLLQACSISGSAEDSAARAGPRSPVRIKARSRSECFVDQRYANSPFMNAVSQSNMLKSTGCFENTSHLPQSNHDNQKLHHIETTENALDNAILSTLVDESFQPDSHEPLSPPYGINESVTIDYCAPSRIQITKGSRTIAGAKVANSDDPEIMINVSDFEDLPVLALDPRNLSIELNDEDSESSFYKIETELENMAATAESTYTFNLH